MEHPQLVSEKIAFRSPWLGFHDLSYSQDTGARVAIHPVIQCHQRIAWIGPFHGAEWSRNRLDGLIRNLPAGTSLHSALGPWKSEWDFQESVWKEKREWKNKDIKEVVESPSGEDLLRPLMEAIGLRRLFKNFAKELKSALNFKATLWIASSDRIALECLTWLADQGVKVPQDLALMGFDDSQDANRRELTSFRFDTPAMAKAMVRQILTGDRRRKRIFHYDGNLIVRSSTPVKSDLT
jgi:DNA-binding LacI/PurR family transcriptional regulator